MSRDAARRVHQCRRPVPEVSGEELERLGWDTPDSAGALWVCPDCLTFADELELLDTPYDPFH